jgi:hypothetical protein
MFGAVDSARGAVEAMVEPDAIGACKVSAVGGAHVALLAADGSFTALQARTLAGIEPACADTLANALLLVFTPLVDGGSVALHGNCGGSGWGLCKANGCGKCEKSDAKQRNFHGCISLRGGGLISSFVPIRAHIH